MMKYLLMILVILGATTSAFGQNYYGPDYLNLHCTKPDPNSNALFGVPPVPGLVPNTSVNGNMVVYCDAASGALKTSLSGGAYNALGAGAINGAVNATSFGVQADAHFVPNPSFTNTSNVVTCTACNFTGTDVQGRPVAKVGQIVFGTNATSDTSALTSVLVTPECVIQSIDSATQIHMGTVGSIGTACNATASTVTSGFIAWGDLDSATSTQTPSTANDPLLKAWTSVSANCAALALPSGAMLVERAEFATVSGAPCAIANNTTFIRAGYSIYGAGPAATIIIPTPNFVAADCTAGCFFGATANMQIQDLQLNGLGNSACGAGFNGKNLVQITGDSTNNGTNFSLRHVIFQGWCAAQSGVNGMVIGSGANTISGGLISDSIFETLGFTGVSTNIGNPTSIMIQSNNNQFTGCGNGGCLSVTNVFWSSSHTFYGSTASTTANAVSLTGSVGSFIGDYFPYPTGTGVGQIGATNSTVKLIGSFVNNSTASSFGINVGGTSTIILAGSTLTASGGGAIQCAVGQTCNYYDLGGNTVNGANTLGTFNQWQTSSVTGTACAAGNFALTSGWGTSTVPGSSGDSHRCHVTITGAAGAASPVLTWTFPVAYLAAPFSCNLTGAGTDSSLTTVRLTSLSKTAAAFTFTGTPTAVTYVFDISCGP